MPRMPFIGVRISWLMAARKRPLARLADFGLVSRLRKLHVRAPLLGDIAADALHLEAAPVWRGDELLLPLDPAGAGRSQCMLDETLVADGGGDGQRLDSGRLAQFQLERLAENFIGLRRKHIEESLVGESQIARRVAPNDGAALTIEQGAIARLVLAQLPPNILQLLEVAPHRRPRGCAQQRTRARCARVRDAGRRGQTRRRERRQTCHAASGRGSSTSARIRLANPATRSSIGSDDANRIRAPAARRKRGAAEMIETLVVHAHRTRYATLQTVPPSNHTGVSKS